MRLAAPASACLLPPLLTRTSSDSNGPARIQSRTPSLPISVRSSDHDSFSFLAAETAVHSLSASTPTKSLMRTTRTPLMSATELSSSPRSFAPTAAGRSTRAWSIRSTLKSCMKTCRPATFPGTSGRASGLPTTAYVSGLLSGALASTFKPKRRSPTSSPKR